MNIAILLLVALGILGVIDASYIAWGRKKDKFYCLMGEDCKEVIDSKWSRIFYFRNETLGIVYYLGILSAGIYMLYDYNSIVVNLLTYITVGGVLFSAFLVYIQAKILKNYCFWCIVSAIISALIFVNVLFL